VDDQEASGMSDAELYDDEYLVTVCAECNTGQGPRTFSLRLAVAVFRARTARQRREAS
jgi:hypothetical protein